MGNRFRGIVVRRIRLAIVVLVLSGLAVPAAGASSSPDPEAPGRPGDRFVTEVPERRTPPGDPGRRPSAAGGTTLAQVSVADDYYDECDDVGRGDIARFGMVDDGGANVSFLWATCIGKPMRYSDDEHVVFAIDEDVHDPTFAADYVVVQWMDGYYEVHRTYDAAPVAAWDLADHGHGEIDRSDPSHTFGLFTIDAARVDFPYAYHFSFQTFAAGGQADVIPNPGHYAPTFPSQCDTYLLGRKALVRTTDVAVTAAAARAAGLDVESVAPGIGALTVSPVDRLDALDLPGQTAVSRPGLYELTAVDDPEPTQWAIDQLDLDRAWTLRPSARVEVAVVDSGIDATRPDLAGRVASGFDAVAGRTIPAGANSAFHPHGTAVAGIAAGARDNGVEVAGVNGGAILRPYRVTGHNGPCVEAGALAAALDHISRVDSIRVVNLSLGGPEMEPAVRDAVRRVAAAGKVLIAATGNDGAGGARANYPASFAEVIGVGATGPGPRVAPYSQSANVEFVAPGGVGSTRADGIATLWEWDGIDFGTGTSYAAPYVSGAVSLWLGGDRATTDQARAALRAAAVDLPGTSRDGHGLVDVTALLGGTATSQPRPTPVARDASDVCDDRQQDSFPDASGNVHEYAIRCIVGWGITQGRTDGTYGPAADVTRGQVATFLVRTLEAAGVGLPPASQVPDAYTDDTGDTHEASLNRLAAVGIPAARTTQVRPKVPATRAEMAEWVVAAVRHAGATHTDRTDWYADDDGHRLERHVNDLTGFGIVTGKGGGRYGPDESLTRAQMATFLARALSVSIEAIG